MARRCPGIWLLLAAGAATIVSAQTPRREPMTPAAVRALTKEAESAARGDKNEVVLGLDSRVRARWGDFEARLVAD